MIHLQPLCFCTNNVPGKNLEAALDMAVRFGFSCVELSAIDGLSELIVAEEVCPAYVETIRGMLDARGLRCYAVSGHCDMTDPGSFARLLKKIEFAGMIGARYLNTRCGPPERMEIFRKNVREAAALADRYGLTLNLESYGDIVGPASRSGAVFEELALPNVRYNYDPGNTFRFARGAICIAEDLAHAQVVPAYLHVKDASFRDGYIWNEAIGAGTLDFPAIFAQLEQLRTEPLPCGLEIPMSFRIRAEDLRFDYLSPTLEEVENAVETSLRFLQQHATVSFAAEE